MTEHEQGTPTPSTVVREVATIEVLPGHEREFEAAVTEAVPLFRTATGARAMSLEASIEHPQRYRLNVEWASLEDHVVGFRESESFLAWRALIGPHTAGTPQVEHLTTAVRGF